MGADAWRLGLFRRTRRARPSAPLAEPEQGDPPRRREEERARLPHFRESAAGLGQDGPSVRLRAAFRRAFTPARPVMQPRRFAGRTAALLRLIRGLEDQHLHAVIHGERGIGKTSMLHVLGALAREAGYLVLHESCDARSDFDGLARAMLAGIALRYHGGSAPGDEASEAGASLAALAPPEPLTPRVAAGLLAGVRRARVILLLDEFDRAASAEFRRAIADLAKHLSDRAAPVQLVIAGVADDPGVLLGDSAAVGRNLLVLALGRMSDDEMEELLDIGAREGGLGFTPAARAQIVAAARGSPYAASLLAHHAGFAALEARALEIAPPHVAAAFRELKEEPGAPAASLVHHG